jgi:hypothetical protein
MKMRDQSYFEPTEYGKEIERKVQILDAARLAIDKSEAEATFEAEVADGVIRPWDSSSE